MLLFNQIQNVSERTFLLQALHEEVKGQCWSQTELAAFYNSPLPDLIVQITASALRKVDALPIADLSVTVQVQVRRTGRDQMRLPCVLLTSASHLYSYIGSCQICPCQ